MQDVKVGQRSFYRWTLFILFPFHILAIVISKHYVKIRRELYFSSIWSIVLRDFAGNFNTEHFLFGPKCTVFSHLTHNATLNKCSLIQLPEGGVAILGATAPICSHENERFFVFLCLLPFEYSKIFVAVKCLRYQMFRDTH